MTTKHPTQKRYPPEPRERAVRMAQDAIAKQGGQSFGVVTRVAPQLGVGTESLRNWLRQAEIDSGGRNQGHRARMRSGLLSWSGRTGNCGGPTPILKAASVFWSS